MKTNKQRMIKYDKQLRAILAREKRKSAKR